MVQSTVQTSFTQRDDNRAAEGECAERIVSSAVADLYVVYSVPSNAFDFQHVPGTSVFACDGAYVGGLASALRKEDCVVEYELDKRFASGCCVFLRSLWLRQCLRERAADN